MTIFIVAIVSMAAFLVATVFWTENQILAESPADVTSENSDRIVYGGPVPRQCRNLSDQASIDVCIEFLNREMPVLPEFGADASNGQDCIPLGDAQSIPEVLGALGVFQQSQSMSPQASGLLRECCRYGICRRERCSWEVDCQVRSTGLVNCDLVCNKEYYLVRCCTRSVWKWQSCD